MTRYTSRSVHYAHFAAHHKRISKPLFFPFKFSPVYELPIFFHIALSVLVCPREIQLNRHRPSVRDGGQIMSPPARLASVSLVAQHPCSSIDTEVHFELKAGGEASCRG